MARQARPAFDSFWTHDVHGLVGIGASDPKLDLVQVIPGVSGVGWELHVEVKRREMLRLKETLRVADVLPG